jgi:DNA-binding GntR family transcriptional regulator
LIRSVLEKLATVVAVPRFTDAEIAKLVEMHERSASDYARGELKEQRRLNYELHMHIYRAAQMPELFEMIRNLWAKYPAWDTLPVVYMSRLVHSIAEHQLIIDAIVQRDAELAGELMRRHITRGITAFAVYLDLENKAST